MSLVLVGAFFTTSATSEAHAGVLGHAFPTPRIGTDLSLFSFGT